MVLFNNPRDRSAVAHLAKQIFPGRVGILNKAYREAVNGLGFAVVVVVVMVEAIVVDDINGAIEELIVVVGLVVNRIEAVEVVESIIEAIVEGGEPVVN